MNRPNIVYILADDLGYGDVSCLNPNGKIPTPHIDGLANQGIRFTDAHATSAVCSPSRYSILTGRYNWRSTLQQGIVPHYGDPLITQYRLTVPGFLKKHGYHTCCIGKWHLGMGWDFNATPEDFYPRTACDENESTLIPTPTQIQQWNDAFSKPLTGGPTTRGFDEYFGVDVPNWPPYCYIKNDRLTDIPSEFLSADLVGNNLASYSGPAIPGWTFEPLLPKWAEMANTYIQQRVNTQTPFFLYLPLTSPHTPISVNKPWMGKSGLNNGYADLVMETDHVVGQVMQALEDHGIKENTLVVFTSDNGCATCIGTDQLEAQGHYPSAHFKGYKSDAWDGGHRIPLIMSWPEVIQPGRESKALVSLVDLFGTCTDFLNEDLPDDAGEDSVSMMPLLFDTQDQTRDSLVHHSFAGKFAIRAGQWKLVLCPGSGGWTYRDDEAAAQGCPLLQLYNMNHDPSETRNLHKEHPEIVKEMLGLLKRQISAGRSTPGKVQDNDVPIDLWKLHTMPSVDASMLDDL